MVEFNTPKKEYSLNIDGKYCLKICCQYMILPDGRDMRYGRET
jgi:hypothetical protein